MKHSERSKLQTQSSENTAAVDEIRLLQRRWFQKNRQTANLPPTNFAGKYRRRGRNSNSHGRICGKRRMSRFAGVTVVKAANIYFDGNVTSRTIEFPDGSTKTLGVMLPGNYKFNTGRPELMEIQSGELQWRPAGATEWQSVHGGQSFNVEGNSYFELQVSKVADYICSFL
jgi:uncharacterized protein YaiE (UPF0345 family)